MSQFYVWVDDENISGNVYTASEFENLNDRKNGFQSGTKADQKAVNSALRQANLIAVALLDAIGINSSDGLTLSIDSSTQDIIDALNNTNLFKLNANFNITNNVVNTNGYKIETSFTNSVWATYSDDTKATYDFAVNGATYQIETSYQNCTVTGIITVNDYDKITLATITGRDMIYPLSTTTFVVNSSSISGSNNKQLSISIQHIVYSNDMTTTITESFAKSFNIRRIY